MKVLLIGGRDDGMWVEKRERILSHVVFTSCPVKDYEEETSEIISEVYVGVDFVVTGKKFFMYAIQGMEADEVMSRLLQRYGEGQL